MTEDTNGHGTRRRDILFVTVGSFEKRSPFLLKVNDRLDPFFSSAENGGSPTIGLPGTV